MTNDILLAGLQCTLISTFITQLSFDLFCVWYSLYKTRDTELRKAIYIYFEPLFKNTDFPT